MYVQLGTHPRLCLLTTIRGTLSLERLEHRCEVAWKYLLKVHKGQSYLLFLSGVQI